MIMRAVFVFNFPRLDENPFDIMGRYIVDREVSL
jgi:hypothetical protein